MTPPEAPPAGLAMSAERLADIEAREKAATPGPWLRDGVYIRTSPHDVPLARTMVDEGDDCGEAYARPNAAFIAGARTDVPDLVAAVRRLTRERDDARAEAALMREAIEGRTTPPTDAEIAAHEAARGWWRTHNGAQPDLMTAAHARKFRAVLDAAGGYTTRWWPLDADGRPCAWPTVTP